MFSLNSRPASIVLLAQPPVQEERPGISPRCDPLFKPVPGIFSSRRLDRTQQSGGRPHPLVRGGGQSLNDWRGGVFIEDSVSYTSEQRPLSRVGRLQVYHKIPTGVLLDGCDRGSREDTPVGRRPLSDRLCEPGCVESRLVALRLVGGISAEEFADRLKGYGGQVCVVNSEGFGREACV